MMSLRLCSVSSRTPRKLLLAKIQEICKLYIRLQAHLWLPSRPIQIHTRETVTSLTCQLMKQTWTLQGKYTFDKALHSDIISNSCVHLSNMALKWFPVLFLFILNDISDMLCLCMLQQC